MSDRHRTVVALVGVVGLAVAVGGSVPVAAEQSGYESAERGSAGPVILSPKRDGKIAFTRSRCRDFGHDDGCQGPARLYVMDADGTDKRQLAVGGGPVWSPDGRRIAYVGDSPLGYGIHVVNADGTGWKWLAAGSSPAWSPDGRWLLYEELDLTTYDWHVGVVRPDGTGRRRLAEGSAPAWSPDGRWIAFRLITETTDGRQITYTKVMEADGTHVKQLDVAPLAQFSTPDWSPDGRQIMWDQEELRTPTDDRYRFGMYVIRPDGTGKRRLGDGFSSVWSPDGRWIAFHNYDRQLRTYFAVMKADGSHVKRVAPTYSAALWSPDGRRIAFYRPVGSPSSRRRYEVWVTRANGTQVKQLSRGVPWAWSPDGRRIISTRYTGDRGFLYVMDAAGGHRKRVTPSRRYDYYQGATWFGAAPTRTTLNVRPPAVVKGARVTLSGKVTRTGIPLPSAQVRIRFKKTRADRFTTVTRLTTGANGRYRATVTASKSGTWQAVHPATPATRSSSAKDKVTVRR